jgi:hypothetical protein
MRMTMMIMMTVMIVIPFSSYCMLSTRSSWGNLLKYIKLFSMEDYPTPIYYPIKFIVRTEDVRI